MAATRYAYYLRFLNPSHPHHYAVAKRRQEVSFFFRPTRGGGNTPATHAEKCSNANNMKTETVFRDVHHLSIVIIIIILITITNLQ